ncbi:MAG: hypothetical protein Ct9H300mP14_14830 [Gammaproteobacteria bacterium]|nr:MAG: hypothetical protein Ct9H300mP14_14830 [Gammaproteobacteria bacterium]
MQLKKLNLSGFKSFVDATSITIPADFTGIVARMAVASLMSSMRFAGSWVRHPPEPSR